MMERTKGNVYQKSNPWQSDVQNPDMIRRIWQQNKEFKREFIDA